jgi:hypothetical protein
MSRGRPFYFRMLRVRHLNAGPLVAIALFEGSVALGLLLALADLVSGWGIIAIPVAVALVVKLNDAIAGAFIRPLAYAQLRTPRLGEAAAVGRSPVPRASHPTTWIDDDDAVADPAARPSPGPSAPVAEGRAVPRGVAAVPEANRIGARPTPGEPAGAEAEPPASYEVTAPVDIRTDGADGRTRGNQGRFAT